MGERHVVFISHANPEDNEFVSWLGSRLANAGYEVWADILSLVGGQMISPVIGDVIRDRSAVVVVALSRASHRKAGVLDEIALASRVGRKLHKPAFVLPVLLDELQPSEFPDELVRALPIDCSNDWANGLSDLLTALEDAGIPRSVAPETATMATWHALKARGSVVRTEPADLLFSNWYELGALPSRIHYSRFGPSSDIEGALKQFQSPAHRHHRLAISFADARLLAEDVPGVPMEHAYVVDLEDFLAGHPSEGPGIRRGDARNILTGLLNEAWGRLALTRGLMRHEFAAGEAWFVPLGLFDKDRGLFTDDDGKTRWRQLAHRSEARRVHWHFAVSAQAVISDRCHFALRSHVVFTEDGETPINGDRAHRLRRSFCKGWWNPRWRDMQRALVSMLAGEADQIELPLSPDVVVPVAKTPLRFCAPVWVDDNDALLASLEAHTPEFGLDEFDEPADTEESWS